VRRVSVLGGATFGFVDWGEVLVGTGCLFLVGSRRLAVARRRAEIRVVHGGFRRSSSRETSPWRLSGAPPRLVRDDRVVGVVVHVPRHCSRIESSLDSPIGAISSDDACWAADSEGI
jgi:hypothetical protein